MDRPCELHVNIELETDSKEIKTVRVSGSVASVAKGELTLDRILAPQTTVSLTALLREQRMIFATNARLD